MQRLLRQISGRNDTARRKEPGKKGETIEYTKIQLQHMDKDGSFSVKHGQVHYGYKSHIKLDVDRHLIRDIEVTTASILDSEVALAESDEVIYRDKAYGRGTDEGERKREYETRKPYAT